MKKCMLLLFLLSSMLCAAQDSISTGGGLSDEKNRNSQTRKWMPAFVTGVVYGGSFVYLNRAWYKDHPRSSFHSFNDGAEWMQVDKLGHAWSAYNASRFNSSLWKGAGWSERNAVLWGTGSSLLYLLSLEYLDGRSAKWGWSWPDVAADLAGGILFAAQELGWKDQKFTLKFSAHREKYEGGLKTRADELFGSSLPERLLKDYNAQTYWLSFNMKSLFPGSVLPPWLNLSIGYGASGMFGGFENRAFDHTGAVVFDRRDIPRTREWYLAPDIDLTRIPTRSKFLRTLFLGLNSVKFPAPALRYSGNRLSFKGIQF